MSELPPKFRKNKLTDRTAVVVLPEPQDLGERTATLDAACLGADQIRNIRIRKGSMFDIEIYEKLAKRLEREVSRGIITGVLPMVRIELPTNKHQNINTRLALPTIPGIAQELKFNEDGALEATALVGARVVRVRRSTR